MTSAKTDPIWDQRFLELASNVGRWSKDPSTCVGAVIVDKLRRVVGLGYNGFPRGVSDNGERLFDREQKYALTVHAELNAILNAITPVRGATLYVSPLPCCNECAKAVIQSGIRRVVTYIPETDLLSRWSVSLAVARQMFHEAGVEVSEYPSA